MLSTKKPWLNDRFKDISDIQSCCNLQRLKYWQKDNEGFLKELLCEYDKSLRDYTLAHQNAIKARLNVLAPY